MADLAAQRADFQEHGRIRRARVEEKPRDLDAVDIGDLHRGDAIVGNKRCESQTKDHRVGTGDVDRLVKVVHPRSDQQVLSTFESAVDVRRGCARFDDEEMADR